MECATKVLYRWASTKTGPPVDDEEDYANIDCRAGVVLAHHAYGKLVADPRLNPETPLPQYLKPYKGR